MTLFRPAALLALPLILTGCEDRAERGIEVIPAPTVVVSSTIFPPPTDSESFFSQYEQWLRDGTGGSFSVPLPLEAIDGLVP